MKKNVLKPHNQRILFLVGLLLLGFVFRVYLAGMAPKELFFDASGYLHLAQEIRHQGFAGECCNHNAGYGLFLASIFTFFGNENLPVVYFIQILMDLLVALCIYSIGRQAFSRRAALSGYILYLFNPFTASFTGMLLSEIPSTLLIILIACILVHRSFSGSPRWWFLLGIVLGLLVFVKLSFYYYVFFFLLSLALINWRGHSQIRTLIALIGICIASLYSLISYQRVFGVWSVTPPYSWGAGYMYTTFYQDKRYPELLSEFSNITPEFSRLVNEFYETPVEEKIAFRERYNQLLKEKMSTDWPMFLKNVFQNMLWMWDKKHLFSYQDPFYPYDTILLRSMNIVLFSLFIWGIASFIISHGLHVPRDPLVWFTFTLFLYITVFFSLVTNETRHTLPFYPLLYLWAGYGLSELSNKYQSSNKPIHTNNK